MPSSLLVVDDEYAARSVAGRILQSHYEVLFVGRRHRGVMVTREDSAALADRAFELRASLMADGRGAHFDPDVLDTFMLAVPVPA